MAVQKWMNEYGCVTLQMISSSLIYRQFPQYLPRFCIFWELKSNVNWWILSLSWWSIGSAAVLIFVKSVTHTFFLKKIINLPPKKHKNPKFQKMSMEFLALYSQNWNKMPIIIFIYSLFTFSLFYMTVEKKTQSYWLLCEILWRSFYTTARC